MQSSPAVKRQQEYYSFRHQCFIEEPFVPITQPDQVYVALHLGWLFSQITEHLFELLVIGFDRFGQKTEGYEPFSLLPQFSIAADFVSHNYLVSVSVP